MTLHIALYATGTNDIPQNSSVLHTPLLLFFGLGTRVLLLHSDGFIPYFQHQLNRVTQRSTRTLLPIISAISPTLPGAAFRFSPTRADTTSSLVIASFKSSNPQSTSSPPSFPSTSDLQLSFLLPSYPASLHPPHHTLGQCQSSFTVHLSGPTSSLRTTIFWAPYQAFHFVFIQQVHFAYSLQHLYILCYIFIHSTAMQLKLFVLSHMKVSNVTIIICQWHTVHPHMYSACCNGIQEPDNEVSGITIVPLWVSLHEDCYCSSNTTAT